MNPKILSLTLLGVTLVALALYSMNTAKPSNVAVCSNKDYRLVFDKLSFDSDLTPGGKNKLNVSFTPRNDGKISKLSVVAYKDNEAVYSHDNFNQVRFKDGQLFNYSSDAQVPQEAAGDYHVTLTWYDTDFNALSCVMFDVSL